MIGGGPYVAPVTYAAFAIVAPRLKWSPLENGSAIFAAHNAFLSLASLAMLVLVTVEAWRRASLEGWGFLLCERPDSPRSHAMVVFYASKYYELFDTVLAFACKGKGPRYYGMHCYHHFIAVYVTFLYTKGQSLSHLGMAFNTFVHVIMYYYYARAALGLTSTWKNWITRLQILQFVTSFMAVVIALHRNPDLLLPNSTCAGRNSLLLNAAVNATFLVLFIRILLAPSRSPSKSSNKRSS
ncbi:hypothetical protein CTAYLR_010230 [Chrysophaeum taylorii]|uniref:Elongation of fatty acids protein n=1 Tax=Chrysophaeum taylorii TaxID=2483200 RepID=A0AAD7U6X6_9STRA|nr:hypothetical protein CTAYLR_010230 [Chrysophaeum taylorii]